MENLIHEAIEEMKKFEYVFGNITPEEKIKEIIRNKLRKQQDIIVERISKRECIICGKNLDKNLKRKDWHIPLCYEHRIEYLDKIQKEVIKNGKTKRNTHRIKKTKDRNRIIISRR
jgi:hypothetical protein